MNDAWLGSKKNNVLKMPSCSVCSWGMHKKWLQAGDYLTELSGVMDFPKGNNKPNKDEYVSKSPPIASG